MDKTLLEQNVEEAMGESIEEIRNTTLAKRHEACRQRAGGQMPVVRRYPTIGRGNVLGDRVVTHADAEKAYEYSIRTLWHEYVQRFWTWWWRRRPS